MRTSVSIKTAVEQATDALRKAAITNPRRAANALMTHILQRDQTYLFTHNDDLLTRQQEDFFDALVQRRANGEPQQYLTGHQEFYKLDFEVSPAVLIPRPETEHIVEAALELIKRETAPLVADIGTGSGCLVISLLTERHDARGFAVDTSADALRVAERNAGRLGVLERITFIQSDLFDQMESGKQFSLIVSNPPYVPAGDWQDLPREVRDHEPRAALISGADGLDCIRRLLSDAPRFLRPEGFLVFEIGFDQEPAVRDLIDPGIWHLLATQRDLQGIPRTVVLRKN